MRAKRGTGRAIDFGEFESPWTGLAAMILVQAWVDWLSLDDWDRVYQDGIVITREDLSKFFRSRWAWHLATCCGLEPRELRERGVLTWARG